MSAEEMLDAMGQARLATSAVSGLRAQLIEEGWQPETAELAVIEMLRSANIENQKVLRNGRE